MPALRKPHRVGFLAPALSIEGVDGAHAREAALLVWLACIETCQRHPGLAVYDPESTPLHPQDGHFAPQHAAIGATPTDAFYATTRRDELVWLELGLPRAGQVRLHALARDGARESFEAAGRAIGEQIDQVLGAWLAARGLGALPRRFEPVSADELLAAVRAIGPLLVEHARIFRPLAQARTTSLVADRDEDDPPSAPLPAGAARASRAVAQRLPAALRVPALRVLELALREDLGDLILAADPEHPRARFAQFLARAGQGRDYALLRRVIAAAPGWARPYGELVRSSGAGGDPLAPTELEAVAGAGIAALCRPAQLDVVDLAAEQLRADGRVDEALRLMERALELHDQEVRAHRSQLHFHGSAERNGAWLAQAERSARLHGCPGDPALPRSPEQIQIDLGLADALLHAGRLDEAIALRADRLAGREAHWPRHAQILAAWRQDAAVRARCAARDAHLRGDPARVVEALSRAEPADGVELAALLDALVALGREHEVPIAWARLGAGRGVRSPVARLAAARGLLIAGEWRRGLEELWRVELAEPGRDEQVAIARCGWLIASMPLELAEAALAERMAIGAHSLARRMARDIADFVPGAAGSSIVLRALGHAARSQPLELEPAWLAALPIAPAAARAVDALFGELRGDGDPRVRADRLVERWLDPVFAHAGEDEPAAIAQIATYVAAQALGRYLAATTAAPSPLAGGLRTVAAEALALVRRHRAALGDREARGLLAALEPVLRRADRWVGTTWLATVERSCGIDERAAGDVAGFAADCATVAARILGPEEAAVLAASVARMHRERADGWESATGAQAAQLVRHTGFAGVEEWADAIVAQLARGSLELADALDALLTACYLAEGRSAIPCVHAARLLLESKRGPAALGVLSSGLAAAGGDRDALVGSLAELWQRSAPGVPLERDAVLAGLAEALAGGELPRAEKLGRWAIALDPANAEAHVQLGTALARQGKRLDALQVLARGDRARASERVARALVEAGRAAEALELLEHASAWFATAEPWRAYAQIAAAAGDPLRAAAAEQCAERLASGGERGHGSMLSASERGGSGGAGMLSASGAGSASERGGSGALSASERGGSGAPSASGHAGDGFLDRPPPLRPLDPAFALLAAGEFAAASALGADPSWRVRRAAATASRFRASPEGALGVPPRARTAALALLAETCGAVDRDALACRAIALEIREQAYFARDPLPALGRAAVVDAVPEAPGRGERGIAGDRFPVRFVDRVVVQGSKVARASDYVALLRDLAELTPREAIAQFDLDEAGYLEVGRAWAAALDADPTLAPLIAAGLAQGR